MPETWAPRSRHCNCKLVGSKVVSTNTPNLVATPLYKPTNLYQEVLWRDYFHNWLGPGGLANGCALGCLGNHLPQVSGRK